jgi:hypothetical protein
MKIGGMGDEVIGLPISELRRLSEIPADVQFIRILKHPRYGYQYDEDWTIPRNEEPTIYLHIRHRYCMRVSPGGMLAYGSLDEFLTRYRQLQEDERSKKGQPVPEILRGQAWVEDDFNG